MVFYQRIFTSCTQQLLFFSLLFTSLCTPASEKVVVMTSYPQEMISQFEAAFEQQAPDYRLEIIWKPAQDALHYLQQHAGEVDVYWAPARQNFGLLAQQGALKPLDPAWIQSPASLQGTQLNDAQGLYAATEIAGLGMVIDPAATRKARLSPPQDWQDLANPTLRGQVAFPLPGKVGFASGLIDAMLRGKSWTEGWAMLSQIVLNARFIDHGSTFITDEVVAGWAMVGITMDFFAASAIAKGAHLQYCYPPMVAYSPAHVAIFQQAPHPAAARAFAEFTLSPAGQQLLFAADIRKLPVVPAAYRHKPYGYFDPYAAQPPSHDQGRDVVQQALLNAMFEATLVQHQALLQSLHVNLAFAKHLKRDGATILTLEQQLLQPLLTEAQLFSTTHYAQFAAGPSPSRDALIQDWVAQAKTRYQSVATALQALLLTP